MKYEPGAKWHYTQSGLNPGARLVEIVSGQTFPEFLAQRLCAPLGLKHTTHTPSPAEPPLIATPYTKNKTTGQLDAVALNAPAPGTRPPTGNAGLYSTATDYARFCQMLLNGGTLGGRRYLSPTALALLSTTQTGALPTGFFPNDSSGHYGTHYGWGLGTCVLKTPHPGLAALLSPGTTATAVPGAPRLGSIP